MNIITVKAPAISCSHCVHTIQTEFADLQGVQGVKADEKTNMVTINFDSPATQEAIETLMAEIGYPVEK